MSIHCERCGAETLATTMSFFSEETICIDCKLLEAKHPEYEKAHEAERQKVQAGNYNFKGVGTPSDLIQQSIEARKARESN
jgi:hypothetical protein